MEGRRWRRFGSSSRLQQQPQTLLPLRVTRLSNTISCWYCDFKTAAFNQPLFRLGRKHARLFRVWFSIGVGFGLMTMFCVTVILVLELAKALLIYDGSRRLRYLFTGLLFRFYPWGSRLSISVADVGYMCISTVMSVSVHEVGHALAAASEGIQIEYTAVFLAILFPGALVAFNDEILQMLPRFASLRVNCAGIWHNAAFCVVCALALFLLPLILFPFYIHGESPMVLDVYSSSPLSGYLSSGDLIKSLDGKRVRCAEEWMEMIALSNQPLLDNRTNYNRRKGYCIPNSLTQESIHAQLKDNQITCPNELTPFETISCYDSNLDEKPSDEDDAGRKEHIFCLTAKDSVDLKKCGDGWVNDAVNGSNCPCSEEESCLAPVQRLGQSWVEITYSSPFSPECRSLEKKLFFNGSHSDVGENSCAGTFVFIGDMISMTKSVSLTDYQPRRGFGFGAYLPSVLEKLLTNMFHVSLMLALFNSLPVYYLDGESILEVILCCFSFLTPRWRGVLLQSCLLAGTLICILLFVKTFLGILS